MPLARIFLSVLVFGAFPRHVAFVCASVMRSPFTHNSKNGNVPVERTFFLSKLSKNNIFCIPLRRSTSRKTSGSGFFGPLKLKRLDICAVFVKCKPPGRTHCSKQHAKENCLEEVQIQCFAASQHEGVFLRVPRKMNFVSGRQVQRSVEWRAGWSVENGVRCVWGVELTVE